MIAFWFLAAVTAVAANEENSSHLRLLQDSSPLQNALFKLQKLCQKDCLKIGTRTKKKCRKACTKRFSELEQLLDVECAAGQDNMEDDPSDGLCTDIISDFEGGDEGWKIFGDAQDGQVDPDFMSMDGNPGGHIQATDDALGGVWYFQAPSKFHGDFSFAQYLQFDLKQSLTSNPFDSRDVIIESAGSLIWFDTEQNPGTEFTSYSILLNDQAGWKTDEDTEATADDIRNVLANVKNILIRGEYRTGADIGSLDNVVLGVSCA